jgi:FKBP-type peptidyl-prolyl cis-trans isomerase FkpA
MRIKLKYMKRILFLLMIAAAVCGCKKDKTDYTETDKQIILNYLSSNKITTAQSTASGLYYVVETAGSSNHPTSTSTVIINYSGYLTDGSVFDNTETGSPATLNLSTVIKGWREGVQLFGRGGKGKLLIPSALGYGSSASYGVPANSVLIFDIELIDFY